MSALLRVAAATAALIFCNMASAYTECPPIVLTKVWSDVDGNFFIATGGYLNGYISPTAKPSIAVAIAAYSAGRPVIVRYARDGVACGGAAWDERISAIGF